MRRSPALLAELAGGYAHLALGALVSLLLVPAYLRLLGAGQWGIVALCLTLQGLLFMLDAALAPPLLRDVAEAAPQGRAGPVYASYLRLYALIGVVLFVLGQAVLSVPQWVPDSAIVPLRLLLVQFLFQFCNAAAIGYWCGLHQQRRASLRLAAGLLAKHAAALLLLVFWQAQAVSYLLPFALLGMIEFVGNAVAVRRETREAADIAAAPAHATSGAADAALAVDATAVAATATVAAAPVRDVATASVTAYALAAACMALSGQIDRLVLALRLPAADYGHYFLASTVLLALLQLQLPLLRSYLPRLSAATPGWAVLRAHLGASLLLVALPALLLALCAPVVLRLWLGDAALATALAPTLRLLLCAAALLAACAPFSAWLLSRKAHAALTIAAGLAVLLQAALLLWLPASLALGGIAWIAGAALQLVLLPLLCLQQARART